MTNDDFVESLERDASVMVSQARYKQLVRDSETLQKLWGAFENCAKYQLPDKAREIADVWNRRCCDVKQNN